MTSKLLVTGANGKLGRQVVQALLELNAGEVIAASRDTSKLADLVAKGAQARAADFDHTASLATAFKGVERVLIISTDALGVPGKRLAQQVAAINAAKAAGVAELVYTSMPKPAHSAVLFAPDHLGTEDAIKASGLSYTLLRNTWYQENLFMGLPAALKSGQWHTANGDGKVAYVSHADCARVAAAALARPAANEILTVTGPEAVTTRQIAALAAKTFRKPLEVVDVNDSDLAAGLKQAGLPDFLIPTLVSFETAIRRGDLDDQTDVVPRLTGKPATTLQQFFQANAAAF